MRSNANLLAKGRSPKLKINVGEMHAQYVPGCGFGVNKQAFAFVVQNCLANNDRAVDLCEFDVQNVDGGTLQYISNDISQSMTEKKMPIWHLLFGHMSWLYIFDSLGIFRKNWRHPDISRQTYGVKYYTRT
ncbi:hypothetical protein H257_15256 [Aphanomyces astaci]|uniref:Uncharacterized protein n=1 Tax=Aphanomyces astaci TaxID=112090 RepID=W4FPM9_APHAT|nr:hypothetical protein H257_15256 [Aphanomyces astaci]ETV68911.1 hypothetical protein H257_15256 [Aphanomyces astaci]|eukprot:XP_009841588.1 hypothetical protein H257_15256 [Aphanomyces astaci]